jgi:hypothetical protein
MAEAAISSTASTPRPPWRRLGVIQRKLPGLARIVERKFAHRFDGMPVTRRM